MACWKICDRQTIDKGSFLVGSLPNYLAGRPQYKAEIVIQNTLYEMRVP